MFSKIIDLDSIEITELFEVLYEYFCEDFIDNKTYLNSNIYINPRTYKKDKETGKEIDFWHLTTRENTYTKKEGKKFIKVKERLPDYRRSERLRWIKKIIENHTIDDIKLFYHQESNEHKDIRLYLWLEDYDFVVILQKLGKSSSFLVTSFYIDRDGKREEYLKRYDNYISKTDESLKDCEWF
ncbi:hypothetical protein ACN5PC_01960 [Aliarcobacter butzleri]|uniref:hypothetical protein n=1 Tax=Aliarcobacter butzleri TaxID=28197 RepID=UPI003AF736CA